MIKFRKLNLLKGGLFTFLILLMACSPGSDQGPTNADSSSVQLTDPYAEIVRLMDEQEEAWSRGDIEGFMEHYWDSEDLSFATKNGLNKGFKSVLERYKKSYPTAENMGKLSFELLENKSLGQDNHLVIGSWKLINDKGNPSGYFSLIWQRTEKGWKIIHDHTS